MMGMGQAPSARNYGKKRIPRNPDTLFEMLPFRNTTCGMAYGIMENWNIGMMGMGQAPSARNYGRKRIPKNPASRPGWDGIFAVSDWFFFPSFVCEGIVTIVRLR
jgi:hypothetical protein